MRKIIFLRWKCTAFPPPAPLNGNVRATMCFTIRENHFLSIARNAVIVHQSSQDLPKSSKIFRNLKYEIHIVSQIAGEGVAKLSVKQWNEY